MKIDLPLENWVDLFGSVPREQLVELLPQIDDRQFAKFLQFFLQKCGEVTLGELFIFKEGGFPPKPSDGGNGRAYVQAFKRKENKIVGDQELPLADVPMPENIKNFEKIHLSYFDDSVLDFLKEFHRNGLLDNVNLNIFPCEPSMYTTFFTAIVPLLTNIRSISTLDDVMAPFQQKFAEQALPMLTSARLLIDSYNPRQKNFRYEWYLDWLYTPREDGKPRMMMLAPMDETISILHVVEHIRKDFLLKANQPISYFIELVNFPDANRVKRELVDNAKTNEQMRIADHKNRWGTTSNQTVKISRVPLGSSKEWIDEMWKELSSDTKFRNIELNVYM